MNFNKFNKYKKIGIKFELEILELSQTARH